MTAPDEPGRMTGEDLERAILRETPELTALDVAESTGVTVDQARRLWWALGFPERLGERAFTKADVDAVSRLFQLVESGAIDVDLALALTRGVGQTMARLADWEVGSLVARIEQQHQKDSNASRMEAALDMVHALNAGFEELLVYAWRRHLAAAAARIGALGDADEDLHTVQGTVGFADIVQFTKLSNTLSQERIGELVEVFESRCSDVVTARRGRVIKSLGDSVLFVNSDAVAALETAEGIVQVIGHDTRMPDVRLGLATGSLVTRMGDIFGPAVNLAARLTGVARRNRVIVDQVTADALPVDVFETRRLPARPVRGFGLVEPVVVRRH